MQNKKEIILAGRLSAVGGFTGEAPVNLVRRYRGLLEKYYDVETVCGILEGNPDHVEADGLIRKAEELSLAEHDLTKKRIKDNSLRTVFSRISAGNSDAVVEKNKYCFKPLSLFTIFPTDRSPEAADIEKLRRGFYAEMDSLANNAPDSVKTFRIVLDRILSKYTWCVSSSMLEGEDISLYDHMKVTEAILSALVEEGDTDGSGCMFALVMADFSGIQKYIFQIATRNASGVAKRLRARSFYVDIMIRIFAQYVTEQFGVGRANILLETGGKFYIMIPWRKETEERLKKIRAALDRFLYQKFEGTVSVNLSWLPVNEDGICNYSESITELNRRLTNEKSRPFRSVLNDGANWNTSAFILADNMKGKKICPSCEASLIDKEKECCSACREQLELGEKIPKSSYILYRHEKTPGSYQVFDNWYIELSEKPKFEGTFLVGALKETRQDPAFYKYPVIQQYMVNHIPRGENGQILTFTDIADQGQGIQKLGVLKMDVDVLGYLFADGLRGERRHFGTISRVNTMSRMMALFFGGYVNTILEQAKSGYQNVYSVFSGGDDLFLIGQWDLMPRLALLIHDEFLKFTGGNTAMTVSATVSVFSKKSHVAYMADRSEEQLKKAKNEALKQLYPGKGGRDGVCFSDDVYSWEDFRKQLDTAERMARLIRNKKISSGVLRRLAEYSGMYRRYILENKVEGLTAIPLLNYDYSRNYRLYGGDDEIAIDEYIRNMKNPDNKAETVSKDLFFAVNTVKHAMNLTREGR